MKYWNGKIKQEHHILSEFKKFLYELAKYDEVKKIIPGRISRQQKWTSKAWVSFSYYTTSGIKYNMKKGSTAQELFITCDKKDREKLRLIVEKIKKDFGIN